MSHSPLANPKPDGKPAKITKHVGTIVGFLLLVELSSGFLQGYYSPLYAQLAGHWHISDAQITWFITVQMLAAAISVPILSKLGDIFGHRRILRIAVISVAFGTALVALAPTFELALVGRALCGPLAVWLPLEIGIVHSRLTSNSSRKAIGLLVGFLGAGALIAALVVGALSAMVPLVILLLIPVALVALSAVAVFIAVPESVERAAPKIDGIGFAGIALVIVLLLFGLHQASDGGFASPLAWGPIAAAIIVFLAWVRWERHVSAPAIDLSVITSARLWPAYVIAIAIGVTLGAQTIIYTFLASDPKVVGYGFNLQPGELALVGVLETLPMIIGSMVFARLAKSFGLIRVILIGLITSMLAPVGEMIFSTSLPLVLASDVFACFGLGVLLGAIPALIAEEAPLDSTGIATGVYNSLKTFGGALAGALVALILTAFALPDQNASSLGGYLSVWGLSAAVYLVGILVLPVLKRARPQTTAINTFERNV